MVYKDIIRLQAEIKGHYNSPTSLPIIIAPTEKKWHNPPHKNRILSPGRAQIIITAENAEPCIADIEILNQPVNGSIIRLI